MFCSTKRIQRSAFKLKLISLFSIPINSILALNQRYLIFRIACFLVCLENYAYVVYLLFYFINAYAACYRSFWKISKALQLSFSKCTLKIFEKLHSRPSNLHDEAASLVVSKREVPLSKCRKPKLSN